MQVSLTETAISKAVRDAAVSGKRIELADTIHKGLRLRISPGAVPGKRRDGAELQDGPKSPGKRSWVLGCRDRSGRARRFPLGEHPTLSISEAREAARAARHAVLGGADPIADRRRSHALVAAAKRGEGTLRALLDVYEADAGAQLRSWPHGRLRIERVFSGLIDQPLASITVERILLAADAYRAKASAAFAVRTLRPVLKWAAPRGFVSDGLADIHRRDPQRRRRRVLDRTELAALLPVLGTLQRPHAVALRFMLLTLARREEVCCARWQDVDLTTGLWTIPHTKNGEPHTVPLPRQAMDLLTSRLPVGSDGHYIRPDGGTLVFATSTDAPLGNWDRSTKSIQTLSGTSGWHRHDLRRTGATMLGELGVLPDIIEAALNYTAIHSPIAATYNRSRYRPQVAQALQCLADELDKIALSDTLIELPAKHGAP